MFKRNGIADLQDVLSEGREFLKSGVRAVAPSLLSEEPEKPYADSPNTKPGSPDGIKQHSPSAKPAPGVQHFQNTTNPGVYQRIQAEWKKISDPNTGFEYFCTNYVYINNQRHGYVHFKLYDYQKRAVNLLLNNKFVITKKFRQAGMSLLTGVYCLWYSLVNPRMQCMIISIGQRESSKYLQEGVREIYESLPQWVKGGLDDKGNPIKWLKKKAYKDSATEIWLPNRSKIRSIPSGKATGRGFTTKLLVIDEAAFIERIDDIWTAIYPTITNSDGQVFVVSTVNGVGGIGGWYYRTYRDAVEKANDFVVADMHFKEHPDYQDPAWEQQTFRQLGQRKWDQEVIGKFLASGSTFITSEHLEKMERWADEQPKPRMEMGGKLLVWKDYQEGHRYSIGADCATGGGLDNSCAQVFDLTSGEQAAEFRGKLPEDNFAAILAQLGYRYGTAVICPELNSTAGGAVIMSLNKEQKYKRVYTGEDGKYGWNTNVRTRNLMIAELESNLYADSWKIYSQRMIDELKTFIVTKTGKVEHDVNSHDDTIFAWLIATAPEVVRQAARATPKQPASVLLVQEGEDPDNIVSRPVYTPEVEKAELRKKRAATIAGTKHADFMEKIEHFQEVSGESDVLSWLMSGPAN